MKQKTLLFILAFLATLTASAKISESEAREKALQFVLAKKGATSARSAQRFGGSVGMDATLTVAEAQEAFYVFNIDSTGGYVIVSGDDRMPDVLGYSYSSTYKADEIPGNMRAWLEGYVEQYEYLQTHSDAKDATITTVVGDEIFPLLNCHWNQHAPYNDKCPIINGERAVTGCTATAMAQIMYYHQWPKQTMKEIPAYTTKTREIQMPTIGITDIDWDNMRPTYSSYSPEAQKKAVSTLMLLCGSAVKMDYDIDGSGAFCTANILVDYFGYNKIGISDVSHDDYNNKAWNQMIYDELKNGRPIIYSGYGSDNSNGHAFVVDGYDCNDYFHINWGWGGYEDDYFLLTALDTHVGNYSFHQLATIGIHSGKNPTTLPYAVLNDGVLTFYYDNEYESRPGTLLNWYRNSYDWYSEEYRQEITSVVFDPSCADYKYLFSTSYMFANFSNLVSVQGLEYLVTENVTNTSGMFYDCSSLTSLDLSDFNTQHVTNMSQMFYGCSALEVIYSGDHWNTDNVTYGDFMFYGCSQLVGEKGTQYTYSKNDYTYAHIDGGLDNPGYFSTKGALILLPYAMLNDDNKVLTFYYGDRESGCEGMKIKSFDYSSSRGWDNVSTSIETVEFDKSFADCPYIYSTRYWFYNCENLTSVIGLENLNTENVTDMSSMFSGCSNLTSLDLSHFDTQNVKSMDWMFYGCSALEEIYSGDKWNTANVTYGDYMFTGCSQLIGEKGTQYTYNKRDYTYAHIDGGLDNPGYFSSKGSFVPYAKLSDDNKVLTFYYGNRESAREGMKVKTFTTSFTRGWDSTSSSVETVVFDKSFADCLYIYSTRYWFYNCENLTSVIGLENLNTKNISDLGYMFYNCSSLTSLDLSCFDTQDVTDMGSMFYNCNSLTSLDLSCFDTQNVTDMGSMFYNCNSLIFLGISNFDTQNVIRMGSMFSGCNSLTSIDVSSFNTQNVTSMSYVFYDCRALEVIYSGENWNTDNVTYGDYMFTGCSQLIGEKGTQYTYNKRNYTYAHIDGGLDNPGYFSSKGSFVPYAKLSDDNKVLTFYYGDRESAREGIKVKTFNTSFTRGWDSVSSSIETVVFDKSFADYPYIYSTRYWFRSCKNLTSIRGMESFNTQNVTDMYGMFNNCSSLTFLDLSHFNTQNVSDMDYMFCFCSTLEVIYVGKYWSLGDQTSGNSMFSGCYNLVGQNGTKYDYDHQDKEYARIDEGTSEPGYFTYKAPNLRGDANNDGVVNGTDIQVIINLIIDGRYDEKADINIDSIVNGTDIQEVINIIVNGQ